MTKNHKIGNIRKKENRMGKLIIDGNSVFEIDEECMKKRKLPKDCQLEKYYEKEISYKKEESEKKKR